MLISLPFQKNETGIKTKYAQNPRSMQQSEYQSVFFVCKKPQIIDEHEYRNGNNGHYFTENRDGRPTHHDDASDDMEK